MRSMFSVVTPMIWVSPRSNSAEPCTRGSTSTSADSGRMSVTPRPSMRILSRRMRCRTTFLVTARKAPEISFSRPSNWPASAALTSSLSASVASSRSALPGMAWVAASLSAACASTAA